MPLLSVRLNKQDLDYTARAVCEFVPWGMRDKPRFLHKFKVTHIHMDILRVKYIPFLSGYLSFWRFDFDHLFDSCKSANTMKVRCWVTGASLSPFNSRRWSCNWVPVLCHWSTTGQLYKKSLKDQCGEDLGASIGTNGIQYAQYNR